MVPHARKFTEGRRAWAKVASIFLAAAYLLAAGGSIVAFDGCERDTSLPDVDPAPSPSTPSTDVSLSDGTFSDADWSIDVPNSQIVSGGTTASDQSTQRLTIGGNPDDYRRMMHFIVGPSPPAIVSIQHYFRQTYDPSTQGAIRSIDYREDRIELNPPSLGAAIGSAFLLKQGGRVFAKPLDASGAFTNTTWSGASLNGLTAADLASGSLTPNFSASGTTMTFGYLRSNSNNPTTPATFTTRTEHGIDNWKVTIHRN